MSLLFFTTNFSFCCDNETTVSQFQPWSKIHMEREQRQTPSKATEKNLGKQTRIKEIPQQHPCKRMMDSWYTRRRDVNNSKTCKKQSSNGSATATAVAVEMTTTAATYCRLSAKNIPNIQPKVKSSPIEIVKRVANFQFTSLFLLSLFPMFESCFAAIFACRLTEGD